MVIENARLRVGTAVGIVLFWLAFVSLGKTTATLAQTPVPQSAANVQRTVWYFYRVKWGFQSEFEKLFARNHLPVLLEEMKSGRLVSVKTYVPTFHGDGRADWTFAVAIVYKNAAALAGPSNEQEIEKRLFPNRERFVQEEQRRFEILDAHWDVPLNEIDLK